MNYRFCPHCGLWLPRKSVPRHWREDLDAMIHARPELGIESDQGNFRSEDALRLYLALLNGTL